MNGWIDKSSFDDNQIDNDRDSYYNILTKYFEILCKNFLLDLVTVSNVGEKKKYAP